MMFLSRTLIVIGIALLCTSAVFYKQRTNPARLEIPTYTAPTETVATSNPAHERFPRYILIPDLDLYLPIIPAKITEGLWDTTDRGISYIVDSPIPGTSGNSIFYGHNWPNLLGNLLKTWPGYKIYVEFDDQSVKRFIVKYTAEVTPKTIGILDQTEESRITLYTCSGWLDSKRFVVVAIPDEPITLR